MKTCAAEVPSSSVGRCGGEEFMILLPGTDARGALLIAEKIRKGFKKISFPHAGNRTVSLGVAQRSKGENADALVLRADKALYEAKNSGKDRSVVL
jgi:diguanylate cyclase (GGDEF)-like protein